MGMDIEHAREQLLARAGGQIAVSEIQPLSRGRSYFGLADGRGRVEANDHERVDLIELSPDLIHDLFGIVGVTKEEFAWVLSEAWALEEGQWQVGIESSCSLENPSLSYLQYFLPEEKIIVTIHDGGGLVIRRTDTNLKK